MFWKFENYLIEENKQLKERIRHLESRQDEIVDAKLFNKAPERLVKEREDTKPLDFTASTIPSDALSVAEQDAWERSKKLTEDGNV